MGEVPVPVILPGLDVAVYVIEPVPKSEGAVNVTVTCPPAFASVAVPIVGAPGLRGQVPALVYCVA